MNLDQARVGVLYPWPGLPEMNRGAARRVGPLLTILSSHCRSVEVLSPGDPGKNFDQGNCAFRFHAPGVVESFVIKNAFRLFDGMTYHATSKRVPIRERRQWWHFLGPRLLRSLRAGIGELASRSDVLMVEYPFWMGLLPVGQRQRAVLTLHDLLSEMIAFPWLKSRVRAEEFAACRGVGRLVCCNRSDQQTLERAGFASSLIPHGIPIPEKSANSQPFGEAFQKIVSHRKGGGIVCFFVGSSLAPNREALDIISRTARELRTDSRFLFVAAGACCAAEAPAVNEIHFGPIAEDVLDWLYSESDVIYAPLVSGTGASLKTLEALAWGKTLVTTPVGTRGYDLVPGRDAMIVSDLNGFPSVLQALASDPAEQQRLAQNGRNFVAAHDSRKVYRAYLPLLSEMISHA